MSGFVWFLFLFNLLPLLQSDSKVPIPMVNSLLLQMTTNTQTCSLNAKYLKNFDKFAPYFCINKKYILLYFLLMQNTWHLAF